MNTIRTHGWVLAAFSCLWTCHAQAQPDIIVPPRPAVQGERQRATLQLQLRRPDGELVVKQTASITIHTLNSRFSTGGTTDEQGQLKLEAREHDAATVFIRVPGVGATLLDGFVIMANAGPQRVTLKAGGALRLTAREADAQGRPGRALGGARVELRLRNPFAEERNTGRSDFSVQTNQVARDGDGLLTVGELVAGRYSVSVWSVPNLTWKRTEIEIKDGEVTPVNAVLEPQKVVPLRLLVRNGDGVPIANMELTFRLSGSPSGAMGYPGSGYPVFEGRPMFGFGGAYGSSARTAVTNEKGEVTLYPVTPDTYQLWVQGKSGFVSTQVVANGEDEPVTITLSARSIRAAQ